MPAGGLFGALEGDPGVDRHVDDVAVLGALVETEVALVRAAARVGFVPGEAASAVSAAAQRLVVDIEELAQRSVSGGNPVIPLVQELSAIVPESARPWVHIGATSQDILDTALMVIAHRATERISERTWAGAMAAAWLADAHRDTVMVGRTLGQQAVPTTFGVKAAGWSAGLLEGQRDLIEVRNRLPVQLGGAGGTLAVFGEHGPAVVSALAAEIGLADPRTPWHTERTRVRRLAASLGSVTAAAGKVATDVVLLAQSEIAEVAEGGGHGGSSAMPHKHNPIGSVLVRSNATRTPAMVNALFSAGMPENERAFGSWHAEWQPLRHLLVLTGGASARITTVLEGLQVDAARMKVNLEAARPAVLAESLATALAPHLGRLHAQQVVTEALTEAVGADSPERAVVDAVQRATGVDAGVITPALEPASYLGAAEEFVERALADVHGTGGNEREEQS